MGFFNQMKNETDEDEQIYNKQNNLTDDDNLIFNDSFYTDEDEDEAYTDEDYYNEDEDETAIENYLDSPEEEKEEAPPTPNKRGRKKAVEKEIIEEDNAQTQTLIDKGTTIDGDISVNGNLLIKGTINGNVTVTKGKLILYGIVTGDINTNELFIENTKVKGNITCKSIAKIGNNAVIIGNIISQGAVITGAVQGDIDSHGNVIIDSTAIINGNIKSASVQVNAGAIIDGSCQQCYAEKNAKDFFSQFETTIKKSK